MNHEFESSAEVEQAARTELIHKPVDDDYIETVCDIIYSYYTSENPATNRFGLVLFYLLAKCCALQHDIDTLRDLMIKDIANDKEER